MTDVAIASDGAWWVGAGSPDYVAAEIVGPDAIADLVAVQLDRDAVDRRAAAGIKPLTDRLAVFAVLVAAERPSTTREIADELRVTMSAVRRAVATAVDHGALQRDGDQRIRVHPSWAPAAARTVAAELKLSDWRSGLEQARRYLAWACASWLILAQDASVAAQRDAHAAGVGLPTLCPDGRLRRWVRPRRRRRAPHPWTAVWAGEQVLAQAPVVHPAVTASYVCCNQTPRCEGRAPLLSPGAPAI